MPVRLKSVFVFALFCASSACANLVANGDFSQPLKSGWSGGNFGGGAGEVKIVQNGNDSFVRMEKSRGPGGVQLMAASVTLGTARRFRFSMRYRTNGGRVHLRYGRGLGRKWTAVSGADGKGLSAVNERLSGSSEWASIEKTVEIPERIAASDLTLRIQFQAWARQDGCAYLEVDDVVLETLDAPPPTDEAKKPEVRVRVERAPMEDGYSPVVPVVRHDFKIKDGLFFRNGKPFFYVGWGGDTGGGQSTPVGLWLAYLQGIRFIGTYDQTGRVAKEVADGEWVVGARRKPGWVSWSREANRIGMLNEPHPLIKWRAGSALDRLGKLNAEMAEAYFNLGHYLSIDAGTKLGREIFSESRRQYFGYTWPNCPANYCEIAREPGPSNTNNRMRESFRAFVREKYGNDLVTVNRIWRTDFPDWAAIEPLHLKRDLVESSSAALALRARIREEHSEHYYDFLRWMQLDTALRTRNEFEDVRREVPGIPVTVDIRGHHSYGDNYCAYDPDLIAPYEDILHVHKGFPAYTYNRSKWHEDTLLEQTAYPLFNYAYFARNTKRPIVNCEDIVTKSQVPGSNLEAMAEGDFAKLHKRPWKFRLEQEGEDGLSAGWYAKDFDDASWGDITVPGAWDEQPAYSGKSGIGWYRARFRLDGRLRADYEDASRKFLVYGKGVAQSGTLWINGTKVGDMPRGSWDKGYSFDVGALLNYGGENEIVWRVDGKGGWQNGLRSCCHVLCEDMLNEAKVYAEKEYAAQFWTYMMRGGSGVLVWNWNREEKLKPYLPSIIGPLEIAAEVALPDLRFRRSKVAYLYGYLSGRGLPVPNEKRHKVTMAWYDALEFLGQRPDVVSEKTFIEDVTPERYPILVVPESELVEDRTYRHFKEYVARGGRAIITPRAMRRTFSRYEPTDIDSLAGKVTVWPAELSVADLMDRFARILPKPEISVVSSEKGEMPLIERMLAGHEDAKVLYLFNWGGFDHPLSVTIPDAYRNWTMTDLRGTFRRDDDGRISVTVPSQSPVACLLTRKAPGPDLQTGMSAPMTAAWKRVLELNAEKPDSIRPKALWATEKRLFPYVLDRLDAFGYDSVEVPPEEWTDEMLARYDLIVVIEANSNPYKKVFKDGKFAAMVKRRVEKGASLLVMACSAGTSNAYANSLRKVSGSYGVTSPWGGELAKDKASATFGDAWQITSSAIGSVVPLTEGVGSVSLYALTPMTAAKGSAARAVVSIPASAERGAGGIAMAAAECGKGRVFVSADAMFCQPFRITQADNAVLLQNIVGWLLRKDVTPEMREAIKSELFLEGLKD